MDLPLFDPSGKGPQGTGGIPPESIRQGLRDMGLPSGSGADLITASLKPEDSPQSQAILNTESERVLGELGVLPQPQEAAPAQAPAQPETPATQQPPVQQQAPGSGPPAAVLTEAEWKAKVATVKEKYGGDFDELAKAYVHTDAARTRTQQGVSSLESRVLSEIEGLKSLITPILQQRQPQPTPMQSFLKETPPPPATPAPQPTDEGSPDFYGQVRNIVGDEMKRHFIAFAQAQETQKREEQFQRQLESTREEMERLKPVIRQVYNEDRDLYDSLAPEVQHRLLLKTARDRAWALAGYDAYQELTGNGQPNNGAQPAGHAGTVQPAPAMGAALPSPGSAARIVNAPVTPPNGNWGDTPSMRRLWKSGDGSVDETRVMMDVLAERQIGEHLK